MIYSDSWSDFELIDAGNKEKLERWGKYIFRRPDPQAIWKPVLDNSIWNDCHAEYTRDTSGGGGWEFHKKIPESWVVGYKDLKFLIQPTNFKHTGLFPEQAVNWEYIIDKISKRINKNREVSVLNLFAYTGGATAAAAYAGAQVCHVDAAKKMVARAKENLILSGLGDRKVRFITDDVIKFVKREIRRNRKYDAVIMDPPVYGRGPDGELWKLEDNLYELVTLIKEILSEDPLFFLISTYATEFSPVAAKNILDLVIGKDFGGESSSEEIGLPLSSARITLPCGAYSKWESFL